MPAPVNGAQPCIPDADRAEILEQIDAVLRSGRFTQGPHLEAFEAACAEMAGTAHAVAVNSGGTALELALQALDVAGGEVIVPTETFVATPNAVVRAGAAPVFADLDPETLSLDPRDVAARIGPKTRAVVVVHMFGLMSPHLPELRALCERHGIPLVEDAAHAHGAACGGRRAGGIGSVGCFSFYATKILTAGEGGAITTDDADLAARLRRLRDHGRSDAGAFVEVGNNFRLPEIAALIGVTQLRRLGDFLTHRRGVAARYRAALLGLNGLRAVDPAPHEGHAYWRYAAVLADGIDRDAIQRRMAERHDVRITWMYEPLCHRQPVYAARPEGRTRLPAAEAVCGRLINLPTHPAVGSVEAERTIAGLLDALEAA